MVDISVLIYIFIYMYIVKKKKHLITIFLHSNILLLNTCVTSDGFQLTPYPSSLSPTRRPKTTRHTRRSATKLTSRRKRRLPPSRQRTAPILPCLQWRPSSINGGPKAPPSPSLPKGRGQRSPHGCYFTTGGAIHTLVLCAAFH